MSNPSVKDASNIIIVVVMIACALVFFWPLFPGQERVHSKSHDRNHARQLVAALKAYEMEYREYPHGDHAAILHALRGENPKKIIFFEAKPTSFNEKGEFIDRWGTPYKIELYASPTPRVSSAGKNKTFEGELNTSDDILSWN